MRILIHYETVEEGPRADVLTVMDMHDECLMRRLCALDKDHAVVFGIDCVPSHLNFADNCVRSVQ